MNIADLLAKADKASPQIANDRKVWARLYPVYFRLVQNAFTRKEALRWLCDNKAMDKADAEKAYNAFAQIAKRKGKQ